jgi:aminopeptidase N
MKTTQLLLALLLLGSALNLHAQDDTYCKDLEDLIQQEQHHYSGKLEFRSNPATHNYDLKYHRLEWDIDPRQRYISGTVTSYFVPQEAGFQELHFDLSSTLSVSKVERKGTSLSFTQSDDDLLTIFLPETLPMNVLDSVSVTYKGTPIQDGFGSFVQGMHGSVPIIWTLSEPYGAKNWWPCKQDLNDKIDSIDVIVKTLPGYRVASNGLLVSETTVGARQRFHWKHRYPIPAYLIAIGVTNYAVYSDFVPNPGGKQIEVLNYVYPEVLEQAKAATKSTVKIMQLFNELFGLYPFADEKYGHAMFGFGGGMEHQTMSFMGGFSHLLQAHELAHQWFGDKVTCGSWSHIWLNEGFATYLEGLTYQYGLGNNTWLNWKNQKIASITSIPNGSVYVYDTTEVSRIFSGRLSYDKGAMLVNMLRWKLGDEAFFAGVRNYLEDPDVAYGYALTSDLQRHLEASGGQDLTEFFDDWLYGEGYPSYHLNWDMTDDGRLILEVSQTTSHASVDFYEMPIPVYVMGKGQDTLLRVEHTRQNQRFEFRLDFVPEGLSFDPNREIISAGNTIEQRPVGVADRDPAPVQFRLSPNPARDQVRLTAGDPEVIIRRIVCFDGLGRRVRELGNTDNTVYVGDLPAGLYVLWLETNKGIGRAVLVKD